VSDFKKILVASGIDDYSGGIFNCAARLALALDAEILVVNVIHSRDVEAVRTISAMGFDVDGEHYVEGVRKERDAFLSDMIRRSGFPENRVRRMVLPGNPMDVLLRAIVEEGPDMIVMGPKGRTDLEHVLVGSVAEKLFRRSPVTVVSYRDEKIAERLKKRMPRG